MRLQEALRNVADIREQLAVVDTRRAFRSTSIGLSGGLVFVGWWIQKSLTIELNDFNRFLTLWISIASVSVLMISVEILLRTLSDESRLNRDWSIRLAQSMAPSITAGLLITWAAQSIQSVALLLPGLWSMFYSMGLISSSRLLPKSCQLAACYFLVAGIFVIKFAALWGMGSGGQMVLLFGFGQMILAGCMFFGIRSDG